MTRHSLRNLIALYVCLLLAGANTLRADAGRPQDDRTQAIASPEKIVQYMRDRFFLPESVKVTAEPLSASPFAPFLETTVTTDDGKQKRVNNVFLSSDGRCFVMGNLFALHEGSTDELIHCIREAAKIPSQVSVKVGAFEKTPYPQLRKSIITASDGKSTQTAEVFVTTDRQTGILGLVFPFRDDVVRSMIRTKDMPSQGPSDAPVTIVEYADLQCPTCARLQEFVEKQLLPKYGDKVRFIFKEFLIAGHDWSAAAAVANECAFQINPSAFATYRSLIFANQNFITAANARDMLLGLGADAGVDRQKLAACLDSKASLPRIEATRQEAAELGVQFTPTWFINGRIMVGLPAEAAFYKIVDDALRAKASRPAAKSATP
jgi:protein-disulfide isomerase